MRVNLFSFAHFVANVQQSAAFLIPHLSFIIDTGATDHMCSNPELFLFLLEFSQPHSIGLPNGHTLYVTHYGDIQIHSSIVLKNVLYVPSFQYNLVSISKLTAQLQTFVIFTDEKCLS